MSFFFAFFESSAQRCQSSWELGHGINSWCHFGCVTNPPNRVVPQQHTLAISVSAGQHCTRLPQSLTGGRGLSSPAASTRGGSGGGLPTAPQLLSAFLVAGAASTGGFPQSTRAGKAAVCAEGRRRDPFSGRALTRKRVAGSACPPGLGPRGLASARPA